jgi:hypothetical protein
VIVKQKQSRCPDLEQTESQSLIQMFPWPTPNHKPDVSGQTWEVPVGTQEPLEHPKSKGSELKTTSCSPGIAECDLTSK